jgi:hypothetical protein
MLSALSMDYSRSRLHQPFASQDFLVSQYSRYMYCVYVIDSGAADQNLLVRSLRPPTQNDSQFYLAGFSYPIVMQAFCCLFMFPRIMLLNVGARTHMLCQ